jgi:PAS domain S-box-containing protein
MADESQDKISPSSSIIREYKWDLAAIVEASDDAIIGVDLNADVLSWNRGAERMFGYSEAEMMGRSSTIIVPPERMEVFADRLRKLTAGEQINSFETERICKDGRRIQVSVSIFPIRDAEGAVVGFAGIARDTSNLKEAASKLRVSEERYRAIVQDQTEMICRSLPDATLTFVNDSYARYFDKRPEDLVGKKFTEFLPKQDADAMREFLMTFTPDEPVKTVEHRVIGSDGEERWHQWTDRAIYGLSGQLIEFQSVGRDITERKQTESALQKSEELNRAVLGSLRDQIAVLNCDGEIIAVNEGWTRFAEENKGRGVGVGANYIAVCEGAVTTYPNAQTSLEGILSVLEGRAQQYREEYSCETPDGERWFVLSVTPLRLPEGGVVVSHIDVTQRKIAEAALVENREELRKSRDEIQQLAARLITLQDEERARVAAELHDGIGQSLAIIRNRVSRCLGEESDRIQTIDQLEEIGVAVSAAIDEVREIAYGLRPYELDRLGLKNAVESMIEEVSETSSVKIHARLDDVSGLLNERSETNIYRVIQEALHNVIDHSKATSASVLIMAVDGGVRVSVADNGVGFDERTNGTRTGFGLSGIEERARILGGTVNISSANGKGTLIDLWVEGTKENVEA